MDTRKRWKRLAVQLDELAANASAAGSPAAADRAADAAWARSKIQSALLIAADPLAAKATYRQAVHPSITAFRANNAPGLCALTGVPLWAGGASVDHGDPWPFSKIVRAYKAKWHLMRGEGLPGRADRAHFRRFHDERARLRWIAARINAQKGAMSDAEWFEREGQYGPTDDVAWFLDRALD